MKSNSAALHHKRFSLTYIAMNDRRRFVFAIFLGLCVNLLLLTAGELFFQFSKQDVHETNKTISVLQVALRNPARENFSSPRQNKTAIEEEQTIPLHQHVDEYPQVITETEAADSPRQHTDEHPQTAGGTESMLVESSGTGSGENDIPESAASPAIIPHSGLIESSESSDEADRNNLYETIYALIEKEKQYPALARRRNVEGRVGVTLIISAAGDLEYSNVSLSSGENILDTAAINLVKSIFPLDIVLQSTTTIDVTIRYSLKN